jgi:HK97 family phage major capsid protein
MTRDELKAMIAETAGSEVARAFESIQEKTAASRALVQPRVDMEARGADGVIVRTDGQKAVTLGGAILCLAASRGDLDKAIKLSQSDQWKSMPGVEKVLTSGEATTGGVLIAPEHSQEVVDLLAARTVVRRHISNVVDISSGMLDMARMTADAATSWGGEIEEIREGQPAFDQLVMRPFQQKVLVPVSNTLLKRGGPQVSTMVRNSTLRSMALGEDRVFLTSPGSEHRPKGFKYWVPAAQQLTATGAQTLAVVTADLGRMLLALDEANVPMTAPCWFMAPRTKNFLMTLQTTTGNYAFRDEMIKGTLWGIPYESTTHIARNEGVGGNETTIYLADCDEFMLGQGQNIQVDLSSEATFVDVDGNVVSAFQRNMTLLRVINEVDLKPQHAEAIVTMSAVTWTPGA